MIDEALLEAEQARIDALVAGDSARLAALLAPGAVWIHATGRFDPGSAILDSLQTGRLRFSGIRASDVQAMQAGETAVVISCNDIEFEAAGVTHKRRNLVSTTWARLDGGWRLACWHSTPRNDER